MRTSPDGTPRGPLTYFINYSPRNTVSDAWAEKLASAPPELLHHGHDVPLNTMWGPTKDFDCWEPDPTSTPADVRRNIEALRRGIDRLHALGVKWVIPYVNPSIIGGDHEKSQGFFHFWKRKREFAEFGFDRVPDSDPMDWMQRNWFSFAPYKDDSPYHRYEPCLRRESWLQTLEIAVELIAEAGYDGFFSDDDLVSCYCPQCMEDFRRFLESEYPDRLSQLRAHVPLEETMLYSDDGKGKGPAQRRGTSGKLSDGPPVKDGAPVDPWATLVWQASQAFWSQTVGDALVRFRQAGRRRNPRFFIVANWGMSMTAKEFGVRRRLGHDFRRWQPGAAWQMLEEGGSCGFIAPGLAADFWTPCRVVEAHGAEPALLAYTRPHRGQSDLMCAEVASTCGGAWVEGGGRDDLRALYRSFYEKRQELFEGVEAYAPVGLLYSLDEIARNNDAHLSLFYAVSRALGRSHIPYDIVTVESLPKRRFEVVINPGIRTLPAGLLDGVPTITLGPGSLPPESLIDRHEIELEDVLNLPRAEQEKTLAGWSGLDLSAPAPIADLIQQIIGRDTALTKAREAHTVRLRPYLIASAKRLVVHVVNYGCTTMSDGIPVPGASPHFPLAVPALNGWHVEGAWTEGPQVAREMLTVNAEKDGTTLVVPPTEVYRVVVVQYR